jgi:hypothetical protein
MRQAEYGTYKSADQERCGLLAGAVGRRRAVIGVRNSWLLRLGGGHTWLNPLDDYDLVFDARS